MDITYFRTVYFSNKYIQIVHVNSIQYLSRKKVKGKFLPSLSDTNMKKGLKFYNL